MWKRNSTPVAATPPLFEDVATAPIEILSAEVALSLSIRAEDAADLLAIACAIMHERPSRVAVLEGGRLTDGSACLLADVAAELEA